MSNSVAGAPVTVTATFCATLVDEWVRGGVRHAVVAPGSRSTPLALALAARDDVALHVVHDERSAAFVALGLGRVTGAPAVLLCTSGTAAANFHPAVVEAHQDEVPMLVCTADRPPELRDVAAPQTIDQARLYGPAVRWFCDPGVPDDAVRHTWRSLAARSVLDACGPRPGPVHLNLPFRDPLVGTPGELPPAAPGEAGAWHRSLAGDRVLRADALDALCAVLDRQRGVIVAGAGAGDPEAVHAFADAVGWPVLADPRSGCRRPHAATVATFDALLRHERFAGDHAPQVVLRLGFAPASKVLNQWIAASGAVQVQVHASESWIDPDHVTAVRVVADPTAMCAALVGRVKGAAGTTWLARWRHAEQRAQAAMDEATATLTEPAVSRVLTRSLPDGAALVVSSSMPVRDVEWYGAVRDGLTVHANRGANGIDGVVSTAVGVALAAPATPTALLIGDLALLHDTNGMLALGDRDVNLTIVVVDNRGGAIFSFLPQKALLPLVRYEQLFGTPTGADPAAVAAAHGLDVQEVASVDELRAAVAHSAERHGTRVLVVRSDRDRNVADHAAVHRAVAAALDRP